MNSNHFIQTFYRRHRSALFTVAALLFVAALSGCAEITASLGGSQPPEVTEALRLLKTGDKKAAIDHFDAYVRQNQDSPLAYVVVSQNCIDAKNYPLALDYAQRGLKFAHTSDDRAQLLSLAGFSDEKLGDMSDALQNVQSAYNLKRDEPMYMNGLGYVLAQMPGGGQDLDRALALTKEAVSKARQGQYEDKAVGAILDSVGWVYYRMEKYPEAVANLAEAAELDPTQPGVLVHLALAYYKSGRYQDAYVARQRALEAATIDPRNAAAANDLAKDDPGDSASILAWRDIEVQYNRIKPGDIVTGSRQ